MARRRRAGQRGGLSVSGTATADGTLVDAEEPASASAPRGRLEYIGGLDGIRAAAVVVVMIGHMPYKSDISSTHLLGGYLGVSTFFTLSGFLITRLLLAEWGRGSGVDLKQFWTRRAKRLLPALYVCLAAAMLLAMVDVSIREVDLGRQIVATLLYFKNGYHLYFGGSLGAALFPLWSLSIEEQFYLLFPLLFVGATRLFGRRAVWVFAALGSASYLLMRTVSSQGTYNGWRNAYYSTPTRASEILAGVLLAYVVTSDWFGRWRRHRSFTIAAQMIGVLGGLGLLWIWHTAAIRWDNLHRWTLLCSIATACLILACLSRGPVTWALELRPIRWMGRVSYGAYLYQILVFFCVTAGSTGIHDPRVLMVVRIAAVFAVAGLSYRYIESPLRHRREPQGWRLVIIYGGVAVLLAALALTLPFPKASVLKPPTTPFSESNAAAKFDATRLQVTGDLRVDDALAPLVGVARQAEGGVIVHSHTAKLCPIVSPGSMVVDGALRRQAFRCLEIHGGVSSLRVDQPNLAVVGLGLGDLLDQVAPGGEVSHLGQGAYDRRVLAGLGHLMDGYRYGVPKATVAWLLLPEDPSILDQGDPSATEPVADTTAAARATAARLHRLPDDVVLTRIQRWNQLVRRAAASRPDIVLVDDFQATTNGWKAILALHHPPS